MPVYVRDCMSWVDSFAFTGGAACRGAIHVVSHAGPHVVGRMSLHVGPRPRALGMGIPLLDFSWGVLSCLARAMDRPLTSATWRALPWWLRSNMIAADAASAPIFVACFQWLSEAELVAALRGFGGHCRIYMSGGFCGDFALCVADCLDYDVIGGLRGDG